MKSLLTMSSVVAIVLVVCTAAWAAETVTGKIFAVEGHKLIVTDAQNENQVIEVADDAVITRDGKSARITSLQEGDSVVVTVSIKQDKLVATKIVARSDE